MAIEMSTYEYFQTAGKSELIYFINRYLTSKIHTVTYFHITSPLVTLSFIYVAIKKNIKCYAT